MDHRALTVSRAGDAVFITQGLNTVEVAPDQAMMLANLLAKEVSKKVKADGGAQEAKHFMEFWSLYPAGKRFNREGMLRKWVNEKLDAQWPLIRAHLESCRASHDWTKEAGKYIPHSTTYLNQRRWQAVDAQPTLAVDL
jgi:hypothetical protein